MVRQVRLGLSDVRYVRCVLRFSTPTVLTASFSAITTAGADAVSGRLRAVHGLLRPQPRANALCAMHRDLVRCKRSPRDELEQQLLVEADERRHVHDRNAEHERNRRVQREISPRTSFRDRIQHPPVVLQGHVGMSHRLRPRVHTPYGQQHYPPMDGDGQPEAMHHRRVAVHLLQGGNRGHELRLGRRQHAHDRGHADWSNHRVHAGHRNSEFFELRQIQQHRV